MVYVHCKIGYSRSAAVVGAYLLESGLVSSADGGDGPFAGRSPVGGDSPGGREGDRGLPAADRGGGLWMKSGKRVSGLHLAGS